MRSPLKGKSNQLLHKKLNVINISRDSSTVKWSLAPLTRARFLNLSPEKTPATNIV